jgi:hypothetical protein
MDDARRARLDRKPNWQAYPRPMLSARASAELIRAAFADVIGGLSAIEELDDFDPRLVGLSAVPAAEGAGGPAPAGRRSRTPRRPAAEPVTVAAVEARAEADPRPPLRPPVWEAEGPPVDPPPSPMTSGQRKRMMGLFRKHRVASRADRLHLTVEWVGRPLESASELTSAEADRVITVLEGLGEPADDDRAPTGDPPPDPAVPVAAPATDQPLPLS